MITHETILVPRGFALVPLEPTDEMTDAGVYNTHRHNSRSNVVAAYKEMVLEAACTFPQYLNKDVK